MTNLEFLAGEWQTFKEWEKEEHNHIRSDLHDIREKIDALRLWRASIIGMSGLAGVIGSALVNLIIRKL